MNILAIIQARGGSKGMPGKNIQAIAGRPLIVWTIDAVKKSKTVTRIIVSTDDPEIAAVAKKCGAEAPFLRPKEFAQDDSKSIDLLRHALQWLKDNENYTADAVVQLKPTNPLRTAAHIDLCVEKFLADPKIDSVITVVAAPIHPLKTWRFDGNYLEPFVPESIFGIREAAKAPRQKLPPAFGNNSCVHVINPKTILEKNSSVGTRIKGVILSQAESINIDTPLDFKIAELLLEEELKNEN